MLSCGALSTPRYHLLRLIHFFTAGSDEVKCWTIRDPCKAPQAAGTIHTDFERGFIMAEVMHYTDWLEAGSEAQCKATGKYQQKGKEYIVEDGALRAQEHSPVVTHHANLPTRRTDDHLFAEA